MLLNELAVPEGAPALAAGKDISWSALRPQQGGVACLLTDRGFGRADTIIALQQQFQKAVARVAQTAADAQQMMASLENLAEVRW